MLRPAHRWSGRAKAASAAGCVVTAAGMVAWMLWIGNTAVSGDDPPYAVAMLLVFAVTTVAGCAVTTLFFLDALRTGGTHAWLWGILLPLTWVVAAPLYWLLYVRPTDAPDGGP